MPKLIVNIEDKIFIAAKELFYEKGYDHVSMREISSRSGIAVGTLYNYYSNKNELYFLVLEDSWRVTFEKLDDLLSQDLDKREKLKSSIRLIYEGIVQRKCMGIQIKKSKDLKDNKLIQEIEREINQKIKQAFKNLKIKPEVSGDKDILDKLVNILLVNLTMFIEFYPESDDENIEFIYTGIIGYFE